MKFKLNNEEQILQDDHTQLTSVLKEKNLYIERGIAVAINDEILPKSNWEEYLIQENDNILIITATQGG
ncbi:MULTISPECIES: sulfur carrier protein ThiS [Reichenbachiella]|uniref:Sulfur carrier protein n=1 Tax=Reichenbachiella agariperforans TaxID=156994 RepID=A0A1M6SSV0_REIAG|nr:MULTISPECIES: sulfur carrier protein ThiS [Reichenbachiella]RJE75106.1 thiamine biosynthesis protein ThiS [Reichenbachiella sp. MSK19-1]SHK47759.1 sulfur carrier protein [Reichenbachiella agariperforans]